MRRSASDHTLLLQAEANLRHALKRLPYGGKAELARDVGITATYLSEIATGRVRPGIRMVADLTEAMGGSLTIDIKIP